MIEQNRIVPDAFCNLVELDAILDLLKRWKAVRVENVRGQRHDIEFDWL